MMLRTEGLTKSFGGLMAVNKVDLDIEEGEVSSIIGPNGAGKTTLFNLLTGHIHLDSGRILFKGEDITKLPPHRICQRKLGRSFQRVNIFPRLSTFDNVQVAVLSEKKRSLDFFSQVKKIARDETNEILESVGLGDKKDVVSGFLAHGDQRRLEIGIALANRPELLLLDEPTAGMSPEETKETTALIARLGREGNLTILFTEHDMNVVFRISERIRVMYMGQIIVEGKPEEVRANDEVRRIYLGEEAR